MFWFIYYTLVLRQKITDSVVEMSPLVTSIFLTAYQDIHMCMMQMFTIVLFICAFSSKYDTTVLFTRIQGCRSALLLILPSGHLNMAEVPENPLWPKKPFSPQTTIIKETSVRTVDRTPLNAKKVNYYSNYNEFQFCIHETFLEQRQAILKSTILAYS